MRECVKFLYLLKEKADKVVGLLGTAGLATATTCSKNEISGGKEGRKERMNRDSWVFTEKTRLAKHMSIRSVDISKQLLQIFFSFTFISRGGAPTNHAPGINKLRFSCWVI